MTFTTKNGRKDYTVINLANLNKKHEINLEIIKLHKELDITRSEVVKMVDEENIEKVIKYYEDGMKYFMDFNEMYKKIVKFNDLLVKAEKIEHEIIELKQKLDEIK